MLWEEFKKHLDELEQRFFADEISVDELRNELENIFGHELMRELYGALAVAKKNKGKPPWEKK